MSSEYVRNKVEVDTIWKQLAVLQEMAQDFGIDNIFQDNGAEILQQLVYLNMQAVPGREGNDGVDANGCEWEMKSVDVSRSRSPGITTNHHLTYGIIDKYRTVPWSVSIYDSIHLLKIYVLSPEDLEPLFQQWEEKLRDRESLNNPKIPMWFVEQNGRLIFEEGDEFPVDPLDILDTRPYVEMQEEYRARHIVHVPAGGVRRRRRNGED